MASQKDVDDFVDAVLKEHPDETGSLGILADLVTEVKGEAAGARLAAVVVAWKHLRSFLEEFHKDDPRRPYLWEWFWIRNYQDDSGVQFVDRWIDPLHTLPTRAALLLAAAAHGTTVLHRIEISSHIHPRLFPRQSATKTEIAKTYRKAQLTAAGLLTDSSMARVGTLNGLLAYTGTLYLGHIVVAVLAAADYYTLEELYAIRREAEVRYARRKSSFVPAALFFRGSERPLWASLTMLFGCDPFGKEFCNHGYSKPLAPRELPNGKSITGYSPG